MGATHIRNVIYPLTMEITSQFGSSLQVQRELVTLMNVCYQTTFHEFKQIVKFIFQDIDQTKMESLNPHQRKWMVLGLFLAIPLREKIFKNQTIHTKDFQKICEALDCLTEDPNIIFSFNRFQVSSEKLCEFLQSISFGFSSKINIMDSKLQMIRLLEERLKERNLVETVDDEGSSQLLRSKSAFQNIQMIESVIGQHQKESIETPNKNLETQSKNLQNTPFQISFYLNVILLVMLACIGIWTLYQ